MKAETAVAADGPPSFRLAVLTSDQIRHRYFVNDLRHRFQVVAVGYQKTGYHPAATEAGRLDVHTEAILRRHFEDRDLQEQRYFGDQSERVENTSEISVRSLTTETLNRADTVTWLRGREADGLAIFGTSLIRPPLLDAFAGRMINMHLGLSPYYRGTATNFYPLLNEEPEYVGATIHLIDAGIDSGPILHHARPEIVAEDMPHTVGCKAILAGIEKLAAALEALRDGRLQPVPQWKVPNGRLYLRKDYHPSQVVALYERIERGLFPNYVLRKDRVENAMRLIP